MNLPRFSRRSAIQGSFAASAVGIIGGRQALGAPGSVQRRALAPAQTLSGRVVIGTNANPLDPVKEALTRAYQERQPDVEIAWDTAERPPDEYTSWLGTQLAADDIAVDIVSGNYANTYRGYVNLEAYRSVTNPYSDQIWDADLNWELIRALDAAGNRIMLPTRAVHINWFYNQDLFDQAGVTAAPTTWTEFTDVCTQLNEAGITPIAINYVWQLPQWFAEVYFDQYHVDWVETVRAQEGDWNYDPEFDGAFTFDPAEPFIHNLYTYNAQRFMKGVQDGTLRFDTPQIAEIVTNLKTIFPQFATEDMYVTTDTYPKFLQQQVAIIPDGSWNLGQLTADMAELSPERLAELEIEADSVATFNWGTFENPAMEGDLVLCAPKSVESASGEYISVIEKDQAQTDLSVDFAMFWLSAAGYQPWLDAQWAQPGFSPAGPLQVTGVQVPPQEETLFADLQELGNAEANYNGFWTAGGGAQHTENLHNLLAEALNGNITPEEYATQLQAYHEENFDSYLELGGLTQDDIDDPARQPGT
jgi:hypothetical protein